MEQEILIGIIVGVVQLVKLNGMIDSKYAPLLALVVGVFVSVLGGLTQDNLVAGLVAALVAMGVYSTANVGYTVGKAVIGKAGK